MFLLHFQSYEGAKTLMPRNLAVNAARLTRTHAHINDRQTKKHTRSSSSSSSCISLWVSAHLFDQLSAESLPVDSKYFFPEAHNVTYCIWWLPHRGGCFACVGTGVQIHLCSLLFSDDAAAMSLLWTARRLAAFPFHKVHWTSI